MPSSGIPPDEIERIRAAPYAQIREVWRGVLDAAGDLRGSRALALEDRFFLLTGVLGRMDAMHPWLYERCREVERDPDGWLDLWAREHYKSTIITFAGIIQEVLRDPGITIGIFSHTKPTARKFLSQIKLELEGNRPLRQLFPDVLYMEPARESPRWSLDGGLVVKRDTNPKEATIEAHGLVDGQPTGAHFILRVYDDVVTQESVFTPEQVQKTTDAWRLSDNLGARGPDGRSRCWHIGTRYTYADTYQTLLESKSLRPRVYAATRNGLPDGEPVFLSPEVLAEKRRLQGPTIFAAQMLQNPAAGNESMFRKEWLRFTDVRPATLNVYVLCDPARSQKKGSDDTAIAVLGIDAAWNLYLLDGYCHKMTLEERWQALKGLRRTWMSRPGVQIVRVGYERYGLQSDIEHFELQMQRDRDAWEVVELAWPRDGPGSKMDRIQRLQPAFAAGKFWLAAASDTETSNQRRMRESGQGFRIFEPTKRRDHEGNLYSLNKAFIEKFLLYPFVGHEDILDATSRIYDIEAAAPVLIDEASLEPQAFADGV